MACPSHSQDNCKLAGFPLGGEGRLSSEVRSLGFRTWPPRDQPRHRFPPQWPRYSRGCAIPPALCRPGPLPEASRGCFPATPRKKVAQITVGLVRNGSSGRRSASPETVRSACRLTATSEHPSSCGSQNATIWSVSVTSRDRCTCCALHILWSLGFVTKVFREKASATERE
jgi:hypothetical protein